MKLFEFKSLKRRLMTLFVFIAFVPLVVICQAILGLEENHFHRKFIQENR